jgi:hypothetical protein
MCDICRLVLDKLIARGLVSEGNVKEQFDEIKRDFLKASNELNKLSTEELKALQDYTQKKTIVH